MPQILCQHVAHCTKMILKNLKRSENLGGGEEVKYLVCRIFCLIKKKSNIGMVTKTAIDIIHYIYWMCGRKCVASWLYWFLDGSAWVECCDYKGQRNKECLGSPYPVPKYSVNIIVNNYMAYNVRELKALLDNIYVIQMQILSSTILKIQKSGVWVSYWCKK